MRNLLTRVPKSAQGLVATLVRTVFAQPDDASTLAQHARVVAQLQERFPAAADLLADAAGDLLAFTAFPKEHWHQIWSTTRRSASTGRSAGARTWWGSSCVIAFLPSAGAQCGRLGARLRVTRNLSSACSDPGGAGPPAVHGWSGSVT